MSSRPDPYIYRISTLAKLSGVNEQTVRRYDFRGILEAKREEDSGYRMYSAADIGMMQRARLYRNYNFTLDETTELLSSDVKDNIALFQKQKKKQERDLMIKKAALECMDEQIQTLEESERQLTFCEMRKRPAMYVCWYRDYLTVMADEKCQQLVSSLIGFQPLAKGCAKFSEEHVLREERNAQCGMCFEEKYREFLPVSFQEYQEYFEYIPAQECLHSMTVTAGDVDSVARPVKNPSCIGLHHIFDYLEQNGLEVDGPIMSITFYSCKTEDDTLHRSHIWMPVKKRL